jgi:hypothetical protein
MREFLTRILADAHILWESDTASDVEVNQKEVEYITAYRSNDPRIGYNRWPKCHAAAEISNLTHL